jgi:crossover junction endodeoxyribonuclease RuvC
MNVVGIDPGLTGGVAIVDEQGVVSLVDDLPIHRLARGKKIKSELDLASLRQIFVSNPIDHCVFEKGCLPAGTGVFQTCSKFGHCAGSIYGLIVGLQLPVSYLLPIQWRRAVGVGPSPDAARQRAAQLYPLAAPQLTRKRDAGRADAILTAHAGMRLLSHSEVAA